LHHKSSHPSIRIASRSYLSTYLEAMLPPFHHNTVPSLHLYILPYNILSKCVHILSLQFEDSMVDWSMQYEIVPQCLYDNYVENLEFELQGEPRSILTWSDEFENKFYVIWF
jgi:hypothetical protein